MHRQLISRQSNKRHIGFVLLRHKQGITVATTTVDLRNFVSTRPCLFVRTDPGGFHSDYQDGGGQSERGMEIDCSISCDW